MKTTGIVRKIDDLGRIVIPKEIRRAFNIKEEDSLEIFVSDDLICFKKYKAEVGYLENLTTIIEILSEDYNIDTCKKTMATKKLIEAIEILN